MLFKFQASEHILISKHGVQLALQIPVWPLSGLIDMLIIFTSDTACLDEMLRASNMLHILRAYTVHMSRLGRVAVLAV